MKIQWPHCSTHKSFASDNNSGIHPAILDAIQRANHGHFVAYGDDPYTQEALRVFKQIFGASTETFFVYNGTGANVTGLSTITKTFHSILTTDTAHIVCDECGSPEKMTGCSLKQLPNTLGKLSPRQLYRFLEYKGIEHHSQPKVVSITQATELGTVYTPEEIKEICDFAHQNNMYVHLDGARIANAAATLHLPLKAMTMDCGVDVLSFGGTKNGMAYGEALVFASPDLAADALFVRKQHAQLASKMRFISAQFLAYFDQDLWLQNATCANRMAHYLKSAIQSQLPEVRIAKPVESNAVFVYLPKNKAPLLQKESFFYPWDQDSSEYRWMTSFDTTEQDIEEFVSRMKKILSS
ncbi:MAG: low specificity L-threonine aldolase [Caldisericia bacterium]|nr:low specificity L-threonine aldolase [Caldisericia bacterium]